MCRHVGIVANSKNIQKEYEKYGVEQVGFLIPSKNYFTMAGGEFCGNATRSAAVILSELKNKKRIYFSTSGYKGVVKSYVHKENNKLIVKCTFSNMKICIKKIQLGYLVDLGGIVHILIDGEAPHDYMQLFKSTIKQYSLNRRDAVGIVWYKVLNDSTVIQPIVWVREIDTLFQETSCGSGSIAASIISGLSKIIQPTGHEINVKVNNNVVSLESEMRIVRRLNHE